MEQNELVARAGQVLDLMRANSLRFAVAESCTGGLVSAALTDVPGSSDVLDRGFVTYSNGAKTEMLGVPQDLIARYGAVSEQVARAMAIGALERSQADVCASVTGIAGPGGGTVEKPVGLVWFGVCRKGSRCETFCREFGDLGRGDIRRGAVLAVFDYVRQSVAGMSA